MSRCFVQNVKKLSIENKAAPCKKLSAALIKYFYVLFVRYNYSLFPQILQKSASPVLTEPQAGQVF